ncbi:Protein of unknown function [Gryllus bimaculatus]|nr:Protein of unknown function [Gryllus bimaculatus]
MKVGEYINRYPILKQSGA